MGHTSTHTRTHARTRTRTHTQRRFESSSPSHGDRNRGCTCKHGRAPITCGRIWGYMHIDAVRTALHQRVEDRARALAGRGVAGGLDRRHRTLRCGFVESIRLAGLPGPTRHTAHRAYPQTSGRNSCAGSVCTGRSVQARHEVTLWGRPVQDAGRSSLAECVGRGHRRS